MCVCGGVHAHVHNALRDQIWALGSSGLAL